MHNRKVSAFTHAHNTRTHRRRLDTHMLHHPHHVRSLTYIPVHFFRYLYESMGPFIGVGESRHSEKLKVVVDTLNSVIKEKGYLLQDNEKLAVG